MKQYDDLNPKGFRPGHEPEPLVRRAATCWTWTVAGRAKFGQTGRRARLLGVADISSSKVLASLRAGASKPSVNKA